MEINFLALLSAAFSTLLVGFVWYNPKVFGTIWMNESGMIIEKMLRRNMLVVFRASLVFTLYFQLFGALGMIGEDPSIAKL